MSNSRNLANLLGASAQITTDNIATSVPLGVEGYSTMSVLPLSGNNVGDQAFVQETNRLYIWNGVGWYNIALINTNPTIDSNSYDAAYTLDSANGVQTIIQLVATDPEGIPIQWSYVASDSAQYFANITNDSSVFTITAKSNDSIWNYDSAGGTFSVTFKASDGVNLATALSEFTITFTTPGYGWFAGGYSQSTIDRIDYANDGITASVRGPLTSGQLQTTGAGNADYGWIGIGTIDRITYDNDLVTATSRGSLSFSKTRKAATGNESYGYWGGGGNGPYYTTVDRIDYSNDGVTAIPKGPLITGRGKLGAVSNTTHGWYIGGDAAGSTSVIERIDFSADTNTATGRGYLGIARQTLAAAGNDNFGWVAGDNGTRVDRIEYANDLLDSTVRGNLTTAKNWPGATGNANYGYWSGNSGFSGTTIDRVDYAADTAASSIRGPLTAGRYGSAAAGGYPG